MVLDYSKWDALELSDDSDIEVHPNVDKRSFIRAKQHQIHQERLQRRHQIATLKYERIINDGLLFRIDRLLTALRSHKAQADNPDELVLQALIESAGDPTEDQPPPPPEGVHSNVKEQPTYSKMMATLVDQVKKEVDDSSSENRYEAYIKGVEGHKSKVTGLQKELLTKLAELEKIESSKITSDSIHTGFDSTHISHGNDNEKAQQSAKPNNVSETVEVLNPGALNRESLDQKDPGPSSGAEADIEDETPDDESIQPTELGKEFAKIKIADYRACLQFISEHPSVLTERETDGLLVEAFNSQMDGKEKYARQCVHQALLLQYCRQLGRDGVGLFFKRITTANHQAQKLFLDDVNSTYDRIRTRTAELAAKNAADDTGGSLEQIQLHAVDPNTQIHIVVPPPIPAETTGEQPTEEQKAARALFESFPPGLQRALESSRLEEVNKVLAKMSVEEAEEVVQKMGDGGMLSVEEGVIDATTEEGKAKVREIEQTGRMPGADATVDDEEMEAELSTEPPTN